MPRAFIKSKYFTSSRHVCNHLAYLDKQSPLFSPDGELDVNTAIYDAQQHSQSQSWRQVFSLTREDVDRLEVDRGYCQNLLAVKKNEIAQIYNISPKNLKLAASYHDKDNHPHLHLVFYSTDKREGFIKVHEKAERKKILNKASRSLKSVFANEIFKGDTQEIKEMKDYQRTQINQQLKKYIDQIVKPEYPLDKDITPMLVKLQQELAALPGRKVYGYLPPELKEKVDDVVRYIFEHDGICQNLLEKYTESQESLIEVYVDSNKTIGRKLTDWQNSFFSPKKGDDASRHNMIITAAINIGDMVHRTDGTVSPPASNNTQQYMNDQLLEPKRKERSDTYRHKSTSAAAANLTWLLANNISAALRENEANQRQAQSNSTSRKKKTHKYNRQSDYEPER